MIDFRLTDHPNILEKKSESRLIFKNPASPKIKPIKATDAEKYNIHFFCVNAVMPNIEIAMVSNASVLEILPAQHFHL